ncbi:MAG: phosphoribosylformylglycinamidine synthase, partial [Gammaproteobacteria bacterium]
MNNTSSTANGGASVHIEGQMQILKGPRARSDFRLQKLLADVQAVCPAVTSLSAQFLHLLHTNTALTQTQTSQLAALLNYGESMPAAPVITGIELISIPRFGTQSPWSSKATDIAHNCGLNNILRLERGIAWTIAATATLSAADMQMLKPLLHDRMTETLLDDRADLPRLFQTTAPMPVAVITLGNNAVAALQSANESLGLALSTEEIDYLATGYTKLGRDPTDVELMMFAQVNSEHCRHKIFNAAWTIDGAAREHSLFDYIRMTHSEHPGRVLSAYSDNAAVSCGYDATRFFPDGDGHYRYHREPVHMLMKVETHNHPTAIAPHAGAATGAGGEIRDEAATGRGAKPKAGMSGFSVSNLHIPDFPQPWEQPYGKPDRIASALAIMLEGPIGAAGFNNEFGRPALAGYFRSFEQTDAHEQRRGYHKPIMIAGGYGMVRDAHVHKQDIAADSSLVVLGGPAMLIGLGGGAASSVAAGKSNADLDFASVQRDNPEMERRCQEVIDRCWGMGDANPIASIHDVGAGGLSNALPELADGSGRGARLQLRKIPNAEPGMSPLQIWCNEAQERYVLALKPGTEKLFRQLCERERAPFAILGTATDVAELKIHDAHFDNHPVNLPMPFLLGKLPRMQRTVSAVPSPVTTFNTDSIDLADATRRVLQLPAVADKRFLITIGDRTVSGLVTRDQMVGPWQVAVADCAVTASGYATLTGEALAIGERTPLAINNAPASGRMAIGEALTNLCAARVLQIEDVALSANWMAACGAPGEDARLYATVQAVSEFCRSLGIPIPVGKDSLSMQTVWHDGDTEKRVTAPLSLIITAFAPVADVQQTLTPELRTDIDATRLLLIDLGLGNNRLGGSALSQVYNDHGGDVPDIENAALLAELFRDIQLLNDSGYLLAYHDRSDGGLFATVCEMAFAGHAGLELDISTLGDDALAALFNEELGVVIQVRDNDVAAIRQRFADNGLAAHIHDLGSVNTTATISIQQNGNTLLSESLPALQACWAETSYRLQALRDNPDCAREEFTQLQDWQDPGLHVHAAFDTAGLDQAPL